VTVIRGYVYTLHRSDRDPEARQARRHRRRHPRHCAAQRRRRSRFSV